MTAIVIPAADVVADADKLLGALLDSIKIQKINDKFPVLVCFDGCQPEFVDFFVHTYPFIDPVLNTGNRSNFAGNANRGMRRAHQVLSTGALVVNQDCILPDLKTVEQITGEGIAVPSPVNVCAEPPITEEELAKLNALQPETPERASHTKLTGFCMFFSKELMDKIGYFDEFFKATFEDDDVCARALLAGFPVEHVNVAVHHYGSRCGSYDPQALSITLAKFVNKWSIPAGLQHLDFNQWIVSNHSWIPEMREP